MQNPLLVVASHGNLNTPNKIGVKWLNRAIMTGFILLLFWMVFLWPKVFMPTSTMLSILFGSGLVVAIYFFKKIVTICGYATHVKGFISYTIFIRIIVYLAVMIPFGNLCMTLLLVFNLAFPQEQSKLVYLTPFAIDESYSGNSSSSYSHVDVVFNGIEKRINYGNTSLKELQASSILMEIQKGGLGYYVIKKRMLVPKISTDGRN